MKLRIAILGQSPCHGCRANCCKQNGHDYAVLLHPHEYARFRPFSAAITINSNGTPVFERVLPYTDGRCQFLDADDRCTIYEDRPASCRRFECITFYNAAGVGKHGRFLELNPDVRQRLEQL
jgi:Fe-S-cluster containining protein